jgi:hypothetical protein
VGSRKTSGLARRERVGARNDVESRRLASEAIDLWTLARPDRWIGSAQASVARAGLAAEEALVGSGRRTAPFAMWTRRAPFAS